MAEPSNGVAKTDIHLSSIRGRQFKIPGDFLADLCDEMQQLVGHRRKMREILNEIEAGAQEAPVSAIEAMQRAAIAQFEQIEELAESAFSRLSEATVLAVNAAEASQPVAGPDKAA